MNFKILISLTIASLKMYFRNKSAIFFSLIFPAIFLIVFGFVNSNQSLDLDVAYINQSQTSYGQAFDEAFNQLVIDEDNPSDNQIFSLADNQTVDQSLQDLQSSDLNAVVVLSENFGQTSDQGLDGQIDIYIDESNPTFGEVTINAVNLIIENLNSQETARRLGQPPVGDFVINRQSVQSTELQAIDYLAPGIIAFSIMSLGVFSITEGFIQLKANGSLKRLKVAPIRPSSFLIGQSLTRMVMTLLNVATMIILATVLFGFKMNGDYLSFGLVSILAVFMFLGMGYAIAGWAKNADQAAPLSNIIFFPMMFLAGTFFPRETFPQWLQPVTEYMPLTYVADAMREIANNAASLANVGGELAGILVWTILIYAVAFRVFRWE